MSNKKAVCKLFYLLEGYKTEIIAILICLIASTGLNLCIPLLSRLIMDKGFIGGNKKLLIELVFATMSIYLVTFIIDLFKEKRRIDIMINIQYSLQKKSFLHLARMKMEYFKDKNCAEIMNNISCDIGNISSIADEGFFFVITKVFCMLGGIIGLFIIDYRMTILVLIFVPVKYILMRYLAKQENLLMEEFISDEQEYASWFGDTFGGILEVKLFNLFDNKYEEFIKKQDKVLQKQKCMSLLNQFNNFIDTIVIQLLITMIYVIGSNLVFDMDLSIGSIFAFITYSTYVTEPISAILNIGYLLAGIIPSIKRFCEFMELEEESVKESDEFTEYGDLEFENVYFSYDGKKIILKNVNLKFPKGSKNAIIGRNGSGKSTLVNLIARINSPTNGHIFLNGRDISKLALKEYRETISVVSQQTYMFNDTIQNNICLYREVSNDELMAICRDSELMDLLKEKTLDYMIGQNGVMLSGGQRQKIALARALILDRPIIILDEATSNTDAYSEKQINKLLKTRLKDKTVIIITHKKELLSELDQIIVVKEGKIENKGKYNEILKEINEIFA